MQLPPSVREWIESHAAGVPASSLERAASDLSRRYRDGGPTAGSPLPPNVVIAAYLATRFPATYTAAARVWGEVERLFPEPPASLLDLGAGAGAATLAAEPYLAPDARRTLIESDRHFAAAGRQQIPGEWWIEDLRRESPLPGHEAVIAAYSLGELRPAAALGVLERAWNATGRLLIVIEPGTSAAFARILEWRTWLLANGASIAAPCPGPQPCPLAAPDWCHFGARVERTALHRRLKHGDLGYEDEKFSYLVVSRQPVSPATARILRRPAHHPGWIELALCTPDGARSTRVPHSQRQQFRAARKSAWGDAWPPISPP